MEYFAVVEFLDEQHEGQMPMAIISNSWIIPDCSNYCYWPNYLTQMKLSKLVIAHAKLDFNKCIKCRINIKYKTTNYDHASGKLKLLEDQSSVSQSSEHEELEDNTEKRQIRIRKKNGYLDDFQCSDISDDSTCMGPVPPKLVVPVKSFEVPNSRGRQYTLLGPSQQSQVQEELVQQIIPCGGCKKNEGLLLNLLTKIENISDDIKYLMISQNVASNAEISDSLQSCSTKQELEDLNSSLLVTEKFSSMCNSLQTVGGKDSVDTIRRILNRIISNDLAISYNWTGRNNKHNFSTLTNITKLILVATRRNHLAKNTTQQLVASDRDGGRERRKKPEND